MPTSVPPPLGHLFQERLADDPFWMLVACSLVNLTTWDKAENVFHWLREHHDVESLSTADPASLHAALQPIGLWRRRADSLVKLAARWSTRPPRSATDVLELPGCGKYAHDSWAIFVDNRLDVEPRDGKLSWYVERARHEIRDRPEAA